jgi:hypothetical protein
VPINTDIADYAVDNQRFGGPHFKPVRMTWIKPSFAWVLYRSGYASKHNQTRILKIKLSHESVASLLSQCKCKHGGGGSWGRVQWDPARDIQKQETKSKEPRKMLRERAIQIGLKGHLSEQYVDSVLSIQDVTDLAKKVQRAHTLDAKRKPNKKDAPPAAIDDLQNELPNERAYLPSCSKEDLTSLGMAPGETAAWVSTIGRRNVSQ